MFIKWTSTTSTIKKVLYNQATVCLPFTGHTRIPQVLLKQLQEKNSFISIFYILMHSSI